MTDLTWPPAATDLLQRLWATGATCATIAAEIGRQTAFQPTRNAVAGKANRLGLPGRPSPIKKGVTRLDRRPSERKKRAAPQAGRETDRRADLPARREAVREPVLRPGSECQWPTSAYRPWTFCGATCQQGSPYCPAHHALAYTAGTATGMGSGKHVNKTIPYYSNDSAINSRIPGGRRHSNAGKWK